jgi:hypothetical protein
VSIVPRSFPLQVLLFVALWCLALETFTRFLLVSPSNVGPDSMLGSTFDPNTTVRIETADAGFKTISVNELGLNDDQVLAKRGRKRILVLGDSYVQAFQVRRAENFVGLMNHDRPQFQFINAGKAGLDPTSEYLMFEKLLPVLKPDGAIIVVNTGDEADLLSDGVKVQRAGHAIVGYTARSLSIGGADWRLRRAIGRSALVTYISRRYQAPFAAEAAQWKSWFARMTGHAPAPDPNSYAQSDFEPLLSLVFGRIDANCPLLVVGVPDVDFAPGGKTSTPDGHAFELAVARAAKVAGASYLDAGPVLAEAYARNGEQLPRGFDFTAPGIGHLNRIGHRALADALESRLSFFEKMQN